MKVYIHGMSAISPQQSWEDMPLLAQPLRYSENRLTAIEPDYSLYIDAKQIRRMSRIIKMGIASAAMAMKEANVTIPDGIITGTGYGCLEDTGIFLTKMIGNKEEALNPTPFIQSTHNTIGSQIALLLQCQSYNQTYTQGAFSFESGLIDAMMQLADEKEKKILVGGIDETTTLSYAILSRFRIFRKHVPDSLTLFSKKVPGTLNGEGAAFFVLSGKNEENNIASIEGVECIYKPDPKELDKSVRKFLSRASLSPGGVDLIISGASGDESSDMLLNSTTLSVFPSHAIAKFKHLVGEYPVATAFACWLGAKILKGQYVPEIVLTTSPSKPIQHILIFNQYFGTHYSLILLRAC